MRSILGRVLLIILALDWGILAGCEGQQKETDSLIARPKQTVTNELTEFQMKNGVGPITKAVELGSIDKTLALEGERLFKLNCSACHKLDDRYVGPAQRNVIERRSPEYILNMILNPVGMVRMQPEAKKMLADFMTPMPKLNVNRKEARAILEYFRFMNRHKDQTEIN